MAVRVPYNSAFCVERQIHQPAAQHVTLLTTVIAAWSVTSQSSAGALSKKCHVQAHIALTSAGSIPNESDRQTRSPLISAYRQISQIAAIHSITLEIWMIQVGIERAVIVE